MNHKPVDAIAISDLSELVAHTGQVSDVLAEISAWIDAFNAGELAHGYSESMYAQSSGQLEASLAAGRGVVALAMDETGHYLPVGYGALYVEPGGVILPDGDYEFGTLIKKTDAAKGIGVFVLAKTLALPAAQEAKKIFAYANGNSLPVFMQWSAKYLGASAQVITEADRVADYPYLPKSWGDDTLLDLLPIRNALKEQYEQQANFK